MTAVSKSSIFIYVCCIFLTKAVDTTRGNVTVLLVRPYVICNSGLPANFDRSRPLIFFAMNTKCNILLNQIDFM
jgi:hypothetical protein